MAEQGAAITAADLDALAARVPYLAWLGVRFSLDDRGGLVAHLPFAPHLVGDPVVPALHGGVTAAFLEITALMSLAWAQRPKAAGPIPPLARVINITIDYLRPGRLQECHARAVITRAGRRYASVRVTGWQDDPARPFAEAMGHFLMPAAMPGGPDGLPGGPDAGQSGPDGSP